MSRIYLKEVVLNNQETKFERRDYGMGNTNKVKEIIDIFFNEIFPKYELSPNNIQDIAFGIIRRAERTVYINPQKTAPDHSDDY